MALAIASTAVVAAPSPAQAAVSQDDFEDCLLERLNDERADLGRVQLQMAHDLVPEVRDWSKRMRDHWMTYRKLVHMPSSTRQGILPDSTTAWGENVAMHSWQNMPDCETIHQMWMNSTGHRANILHPSFRYVAIGTYVDGTGWWATQLFFNASDYTPPCHGSCDDEIFFYRNDGLYRYYNVNPNGTIGSPINAGDNYTNGWDSITAIDLDGNGRDEIFFYRDDGLYRYYNVNPNGTLGSPINAGDNYTNGWDSITAIDLDGNGRDEIFFYRDDGLYRYYNVRPNGTIGSPINAGDNYTNGWDTITSISLD